MKKLENKTALITGGNSGIGYATAQRFIEEGAKVIITGRNSEAVAEAIKTLGHNTIGIVCDAAKMNDIKTLKSELAKYKVDTIDVLFYNAGVGQYAPVGVMTEEMFDANMNINFKGAFFTVQNLLPQLNEGASIIFNGSSLANVSMPGNGAYGASKASLIMLAKTLALELAEQKIRTNVVSPGNINTPIYSKLGLTDEELQGFANNFIPKIPLARFGEPKEIANVATFLASDESSFVTGTEIVADGGYVAQ